MFCVIQIAFISLFQTDLFSIEAVDLGKLTKVTVGHDGFGRGSGWFLEEIIIQESDRARKKYVFKCNRSVF